MVYIYLLSYIVYGSQVQYSTAHISGSNKQKCIKLCKCGALLCTKHWKNLDFIRRPIPYNFRGLKTYFLQNLLPTGSKVNTKVFFGNFSLFTDSIPPEEAKKAKIQKSIFWAKIGRKWREKVPLNNLIVSDTRNCLGHCPQ